MNSPLTVAKWFRLIALDKITSFNTLNWKQYPRSSKQCFMVSCSNHDDRKGDTYYTKNEVFH